jgi:predicted transglutaminase-like protease
MPSSAYWLTVVNQRWLGMRVDFLGSLLTLAVALLTVGTRFTISPAQTGVTLSYILIVQQVTFYFYLLMLRVIIEFNPVFWIHGSPSC